MLDIQFIREHTDIVKESQRKRGESVELVDEVLSSDTARREALKAFEEARAQQKEIGKKVQGRFRSRGIHHRHVEALQHRGARSSRRRRG